MHRGAHVEVERRLVSAIDKVAPYEQGVASLAHLVEGGKHHRQHIAALCSHGVGVRGHNYLLALLYLNTANGLGPPLHDSTICSQGPNRVPRI